MSKSKLFIFSAFLIFFFAISLKTASASEGIVELRSTTGQNSRCFAVSVYLTDGQYHILVTCRDVIYPADPKVLNYILWATPEDDKKPIRLGKIGVGKLSAQTKSGFSNLFVTKEENAEIKQPSGPLIMRGDARPISFLEGPLPPEEPKETPAAGEEGETAEEYQEKTKTPFLGGLVSILKNPAVIPLVALLAILFFLFYIIRRRV
jgi:hypothetical protein